MTINYLRFRRSIALAIGNGKYGPAAPGIDISWTFRGKVHFLWATLRGFHHSAI